MGHPGHARHGAGENPLSLTAVTFSSLRSEHHLDQLFRFDYGTTPSSNATTCTALFRTMPWLTIFRAPTSKT